MNSATPFLWFNDNAHEAAAYYASVIPGARVVATDALSATFEIDGREYVAFNGGTYYALTPAFSIMVDCPTQAEIDTLWVQLLAGGGQESRCGWLVDRFGLSWQVAPRKVLSETSFGPDPVAAKRAFDAMLTMAKLDIDGLKKAYDGL